MNGKPDHFGGFDIRKYFDLSTAHITSKDNKILEEIAHPSYYGPINLYVISIDQGFIVSVPSDIHMFEERLALVDAGLSLALVDLLLHAHNHGMHGLWFDADADKSGGFPCFFWEKNDEIYYHKV